MTKAEQLAQAYAVTIYGPANAWGQHVHPIEGISHAIMHRVRQLVGTEKGDELIMEAMTKEAARIRASQ